MARTVPHLAILDVGHGNAAVLVDRCGVVVIDTGPKAAAAGLLEYLQEQAIDKVDVVLISHADEDHLGGLIGLLASREVVIGRVRVNSDAAKGTAVWKDLVHELSDHHGRGELHFLPALYRDQGEIYAQGEVHVEIIGPTVDFAATGPGSTDSIGRRITSNSASAVVRLSHEGGPVVLLCGDLDQTGLDELLRIGASLTADVLVFPHHGGHAGGSKGEAFAELLTGLVAPSTVIFSIGRGKYNTPRPEVVAAIRRQAPTARLVCTQLSARCATVLPQTPPVHLHHAFAWGRSSGACCAGTVVIPFRSEAELLPTPAGHRAFIAASAPDALCAERATDGA